MGLIAMMKNTNVIVYYPLSIKLKIEVVSVVKLKYAVLVKISKFRMHSVSSSIAMVRIPMHVGENTNNVLFTI